MPVLLLADDRAPGAASLAVVDTGAAVNMVSRRYADAHRLVERIEPRLFVQDAMKRRHEGVTVAHLPRLSIGASPNVTFEGFDAVVDETGALAKLSANVDLLFSRELFRDLLVTIDYPRRRLILERGQLPQPDGQEILALRRDEDGSLLVPLTVQTDREPAWLTLDTGHTSEGLLLSRYRLLGINWATKPVEGDVIHTFFGSTVSRVGRMSGDVRVGRYTFRRPIAAISMDDDQELFGADMLRHFIVTIDQRNNRVRLALLSESISPVFDVPPVRRLGFSVDGRSGAVKLDPDSEAARAGLLDGDRIVTINGVPAARLNYLHHAEFERHGQPLLLRVRRNQDDILLHVPLTVIVP
jgi:hypothetical protein